MSITDWVAIAALFISLAVGFFNYFYTKKTFAAAYYPRVIFTPKAKTCSGGCCLNLKIKNLSQTYTLTEIKLNLSILSPRRYLFFGQKQINLYEAKFLSLPPAEEIIIDRIPDNSHKNLEEFCVDNFPDWIQPVNTNIAGRIYCLINKRKAKLLIVLTYTPGVMGADRVSITKQFNLSPGFHEELHKMKQINHWEIS